MDDWPFSGASGKHRVAPWYFAQVYQGSRGGVEYARKWIRDHGLHKHHKAEQMVVLLMSVDEALLYDGVDILNSAAFEVIARRCYALEKVFAKCRTREERLEGLEEDEGAHVLPGWRSTSWSRSCPPR